MKIKLVAITLLILGLLGGLLFSLTTASADPCEVNKAIAGDDATAGSTEVFSDDQVGQCNASLIEAIQIAKADATSETTAVAVGDDSTAEAASETNATAYNTISVTQSNTADDITQVDADSK